LVGGRRAGRGLDLGRRWPGRLRRLLGRESRPRPSRRRRALRELELGLALGSMGERARAHLLGAEASGRCADAAARVAAILVGAAHAPTAPRNAARRARRPAGAIGPSPDAADADAAAVSAAEQRMARVARIVDAPRTARARDAGDAAAHRSVWRRAARGRRQSTRLTMPRRRPRQRGLRRGLERSLLTGRGRLLGRCSALLRSRMTRRDHPRRERSHDQHPLPHGDPPPSWTGRGPDPWSLPDEADARERAAGSGRAAGERVHRVAAFGGLSSAYGSATKIVSTSFAWS